MIKRTIRETVNEYDSEGKLVRQTVTETKEDDDTIYHAYPSYTPTYAPPPTFKFVDIKPTCVDHDEDDFR